MTLNFNILLPGLFPLLYELLEGRKYLFYHYVSNSAWHILVLDTNYLKEQIIEKKTEEARTFRQWGLISAGGAGQAESRVQRGVIAATVRTSPFPRGPF